MLANETDNLSNTAQNEQIWCREALGMQKYISARPQEHSALVTPFLDLLRLIVACCS